MDWKIVADSSCDYYKLENNEAGINFESVPFVMSIDGIDYVDTENLNVSELIKAMEECKETSLTSCPSPDKWYNAFGTEKNVIAITISSSLSGSYNSACVAKNMVLEEEPDRNIEILDSLSTGPEMCLVVRKLQELISQGLEFDEVVKKIRNYMKTVHTVFALASFDNLVRNGRIPKIAGLVAGKLKLWGIGIGSETGTIEVKKITRGTKRVIDTIVDDIKTRSENCKSVIIAHCENEELAEKIKEKINEVFSNIDIKIMPTRGLCSYYAEKNGIIVGF